MIGKTISHYNISEKLGSGGMGTVYKAHDTKLDRFVALKFLSSQIVGDEDYRQRFKIEARAVAALNHPNIMAIHAIEDEDDDDEMFIVMEFIDGQELKELSQKKAGAQFTVEDIIGITKQIAEGLQAAHEKSIVHRDVKPANIMIDQHNKVKITDFGIAKFLHDSQNTELGLTVGTPHYMSPEQSRGEPIDARTDIWALGVILYELLTGELPFTGHYDQAIIYSIIHNEPKALTELKPPVPAGMAAVVQRALQKDPANRYQNMAELLLDLKTLSEESTMATALPGSGGEQKPHSLAVLPFRDLSAERDQEYFCDGITEELLNALAKVQGWRVLSRTSVFAFKHKQADTREFGKQLNVDHLLEGSVRKAGNRLRITAQLISVVDGFQVWSEKFDCELDDVFEVQDEIARIITRKLQPDSQQSEATLVKKSTEHVEAYNLYLQARFQLNKRSEGSLRKSIEYCEQALKIDPDYALTYACLADSYILLSFQGAAPPKQVMPKAKAAAESALDLDRNLAEAHTSLACILAVYHRNWPESEMEFKRAIELNPNSATAHYWYAIWLLLPRGEFRTALDEISAAQTLDPLSLVVNTGIGWQHYFAREYDLAIVALRRVLEMDKSFVFARDILGQAFAQQKKFGEAIAELEKTVHLSNRRPLSLCSLANVFALATREQEAGEILEELLKIAKHTYVSAYDIALVYAGLGHADLVFEWLETAFEEHNGWLNFLNIEPRFENIRTDQRFTKLLSQMQLNA